MKSRISLNLLLTVLEVNLFVAIPFYLEFFKNGNVEAMWSMDTFYFLAIWLPVVLITSMLVYQSWGCVRYSNGTFTTSNWSTDKRLAITYVLVNVVPLIGVFLLSNQTLAGCVIVVAHFGWMGYSQIKRNKVRDQIDEHGASSEAFLRSIMPDGLGNY